MHEAALQLVLGGGSYTVIVHGGGSGATPGEDPLVEPHRPRGPLGVAIDVRSV